MYLASVPNVPTTAPVSDDTVTNGFYIKVNYLAVPVTGGLPILSYELQIGSLEFDDFLTIVGADPYTLQLTFVVSSNILKGEKYAFRYRAIN